MITPIRTPIAVAIAMGLVPNLASAGVYNLGGSCPSQGAWTQMALQQSQQIAQAIRQLKDNPACKGIDQVLADLQTSQRDLQNTAPDGEAQRESQLESMPQEMQALKGAIAEGGAINQDAPAMLMNRTLKAASISSDLAANSTSATKTTLFSGGLKSKALTALFNKIQAPTAKGLDMISAVMQKLPDYDECLIGHPRQGLAILSGAVKTAAAFSAAGEGVGDKLGNAIVNLATMARDRRFTKALRETDETEFWFSVSCLLESTSKNYCEAENAQEILKYTKDQYIAAQKKNAADPNRDNPLEGYYLMVRDLPTISTWLQKVQFGATPRLRADASFKTKIWNQVTDLTNKTNDIAGFFNEQMILLRELPDTESKQNQLYTILDNLIGMLSGAGGDTQASDSALFFNTTINSNYLPFFLIGRKEIPPECRVNSNGGVVMNPLDYIKTGGVGGKYIEEFNDPVALASVIEDKMNWVIQQAGVKASKYFQERLIVDQANLVNQTMSDQYLTVQKALQNVYNYLVRFEKRLVTNKDRADIMMIPSIRETKVKIQKVLRSYDDLRKLGEQMVLAPTKINDNDLSPKVKTAAKKVIDTVFEEFNMWLQKDSFLTGRLSTMIQKDFQMRIKNGQNMTQYQQDILTITQQHLLDKLISVHGVNPTNSQQDLYQAQVINRRNLHVFEEVFQDTMYRMIIEMKSIVDGKGEAGVRESLKKKIAEERSTRAKTFLYLPIAYPAPGTGIISWLLSPSVHKRHPGLFESRHTNVNKVTGIDDVYGSTAQVMAKFCAQTLAFENRAFFRDVCRNTRLKSYYSDGTSKNTLDLTYNDFVPAKGNTDFIRKNAKLTSKAICAINTFNTRNLVQWMKDQDEELLDDGSVQ
ncbi:MAG: hypothetical protein JST80_09980 [Bdellovibrionales bacterium]|nr:hypothetical protein [Bdellovibrionales bacterium]